MLPFKATEGFNYIALAYPQSFVDGLSGGQFNRHAASCSRITATIGNIGCVKDDVIPNSKPYLDSVAAVAGDLGMTIRTRNPGELTLVSSTLQVLF